MKQEWKGKLCSGIKVRVWKREMEEWKGDERAGKTIKRREREGYANRDNMWLMALYRNK